MPTPSARPASRAMLRKVLGADAQVKVLSASGSGTIRFYLSTFGNWDRVRPVPERPRKGAFTPYLAAFLTDGFIAYAHDWDVIPIGFPTAAYEDDYGLLVDAEYHSTDPAQMVRTTVQERLAAGKSVKTSMGYDIEEDAYVPMDDPALQAAGITRGRELVRVPLYEGSIVNVPMNAAADLTAAKALALAPRTAGALSAAVKACYADADCLDWEAQDILYTLLSYVREGRALVEADPAVLVLVAALLGEARTVVTTLLTTAPADAGPQGKRSPVPRLPFALQAAYTTTAVKGLLTRAEGRQRVRAKEGRMLSDANRTKLTDLQQTMQEMMTLLDDLLAASAPPKSARAGWQTEYLRFAAATARMRAREYA